MRGRRRSAPLASDMKVRMEATAHIFGNVIPNLDPTPYFPEIDIR